MADTPRPGTLAERLDRLPASHPSSPAYRREVRTVRWSDFELDDAADPPAEPAARPAGTPRAPGHAEETARRYALDRPFADDDPQTPREVVSRFDPRRAGLPDVPLAEALDYIADHRARRPWLEPARGRFPEVQRVIACLDRGAGHALERHEGAVTDEQLERRVTRLEDPAQLHPDKRAKAVDAYRENQKNDLHRCGIYATRISDPDAFATAFARAVEHPTVRRALETPFDPDKRPANVRIPIRELLGERGHEYCTGYQLVGPGSPKEAMEARNRWVGARRQDVDAPSPGLVIRRIPTFEGGHIKIAFQPNSGKTGFEIATMYPDPPRKATES